ncbi:uncharacterized protein BX663DRAFT_526648 [Cokeromyces recurvatus]|uniref:uncharacterized protein n=1 Tax=Cokeromyces recurvatus TaxID=90255 RepID=UPI0022200A3F|nr:uncharacterized protein BX663DRAFT_526648 [Cokeromyces recurvatus]KAI7897976.1 hypothetical protein BX663DRAFT_526648 [Cokeromyces recurvatus]
MKSVFRAPAILSLIFGIYQQHFSISLHKMTENTQVQWILNNYDGYGTFPSLMFAKFSKVEDLKTCENIFKKAVDDIATLSIKQYKNHSKWIKWTRQVKR